MNRMYSTMQQEAITQVRLDSRHGIPPMDGVLLKWFCTQNGVTADDVRAAEKQGRALRDSGARCMCAYCEGHSSGIGGRERLRHHYAASRNSTLEAQGIADPVERARIIEEEINSGAALQQGPITVTRQQGSPS